jgi:hypothetical protein
MKRTFSTFACAAGLLLSTTAQADECTGVVQSITLAPEGDLSVKFYGNIRMRICQLDASVTVDRGSAFGGTTMITAGRCAGLLSSFMTAKASSTPVTARVSGACTFVDGAFPNPYPFQFVF